MTKEETKPKTLAGKLAQIGKEIGKIDKTGKNQGYGTNYNFIEYGVVAGRIRTLFAEYGVIIQPEVVEYDKQEIRNAKGSTGYHYVLTMKFTAINADDTKDALTSMWVGESADYGDKGINKAITAGTKYFIMRLFNVSEREDEDPDKQTVSIASAEPTKKTPVALIIEKVADLDTVEAVEKARQATFEKYKLLTNIDQSRLNKAFEKRIEELTEDN